MVVCCYVSNVFLLIHIFGDEAQSQYDRVHAEIKIIAAEVEIYVSDCDLYKGSSQYDKS